MDDATVAGGDLDRLEIRTAEGAEPRPASPCDAAATVE